MVFNMILEVSTFSRACLFGLQKSPKTSTQKLSNLVQNRIQDDFERDIGTTFQTTSLNAPQNLPKKFSGASQNRPQTPTRRARDVPRRPMSSPRPPLGRFRIQFGGFLDHFRGVAPIPKGNESSCWLLSPLAS